MRRRVLGAVVFMGFVLGGGAAASASAEGPSAVARCPAYGAHLGRARAYLARGERAAALAELRRARVALETCLREEAGDAHLLAGLSASPPPA